jgi:hypothetical protein
MTTIRVLLAALLLAFLAVFAFSKPTNPNSVKPVAPKAKEVNRPRIMGYVTNYGDCLSSGPNQFTIEGQFWSAVGTIRNDGSVTILWTSLASGNLYIGVYHVGIEGNLQGIYGNVNNAKLEENGELTGTFFSERVYRIEPELPDI